MAKTDAEIAAAVRAAIAAVDTGDNGSIVRATISIGVEIEDSEAKTLTNKGVAPLIIVRYNTDAEEIVSR